ncbi:MAG: CocE/NonD family hydrolase [Thermoplasmatota archaeon]
MLAVINHVRVPTLDGLFLDGAVFMPNTPAGVQVPTVLLSSPYPGQGNHAAPDDPGYLDGNEDGVPGRALVESGFALAVFNLRGTGSSGGCLSLLSHEEQRDQATLVDWISAQPWSNGRVGMMGLSIPGTAAMEAASLQPPALKAIVVAGTFPDLYLQSSTPQGAMWATYGPYMASQLEGIIGLQPPVSQGDPLAVAEYGEVAGQRACAEPFPVGLQTTIQPWVNDRNEAFWKERQLTSRFANVTAAVMLAQGFHDGNLFTDDEDWGMLASAPKAFLHGPWQHRFPVDDADWPGPAIEWFNFWLKGLPPVPRGLDEVNYQDNEGVWRTTATWPPSEVREEAMYLAEEALSPLPMTTSTTFFSAPADQGLLGLYAGEVPELQGAYPSTLHMFCPPSTTAGFSALFQSAPMENPVTIAGNPFAWLNLTTDQANGFIAMALVDQGPDAGCTANVPHGIRLLAIGAADLRFASGNFVAQPPPTNQPFSLRIDFHSLAETIPAGHRIAIAFAHGSTDEYQSAGLPPQITISGDGSVSSSHLVLPIVAGSLGGKPTELSYPARPHLPSGTST